MNIPRDRLINNNSYKREQVATYYVMKQLFPKAKIHMEYRYRYPNTEYSVGCIPDIMLFDTCQRCKKQIKMVVRLNGTIHLRNHVMLKDLKQKTILEHDGCLVRDLNTEYHAELFKYPNSVEALNHILNVIKKEWS